MDAIALHLEIRNALSLADELSRHEHADGNDGLAGHLSAIRSVLARLEREVGRSHEMHVAANPAILESLEHGVTILRKRIDEVPVDLQPRLGQLLSALDRVVFAQLRPEEAVPAKPLFGRLPLKRIVPQDVHAILDYVSVASLLVSAKLARTRRGRVVGLLLGGSVGGAALATDYRLSAKKVLPVELHELLDHAAGVGAILAPVVLGYFAKDPVASILQMATGLGQVVVSLLTDYRAERGVGRALRSRGGPRRRTHTKTGARTAPGPIRVNAVQHPLEASPRRATPPAATSEPRAPGESF